MLWAASQYSYLLFHSTAEIFSIVVACGIFVLAWNSRRFAENTYLLFVGIAYLFVAGLDLLHTLAFKGSGVFYGHESNLATQLWISARYVEGVSLLVAACLIDRKPRVSLTLAAYGVVISLLLASIFYWNIFPACFVEEQGLTAFKKISEYIICFLLIASIGMLLRQRRAFEPHILRLLIASIAVTIASELAFTLYVNVEGFPNLIGHYLKIISFYLIYKAIIQTGLTKPFALLLRDLKQSEEALKAAKENLESEVEQRTAELQRSVEKLQEAELRYRTVADFNYDWEYWENPDGTLSYVSPSCRRLTGYTAHEFIDNPELLATVVIGEDRDLWKRHRQEALETPTLKEIQFRIRTRDGRIRWIEHACQPVKYESGEFLGLRVSNRDVTERKQAEEALQEGREKLESRVRERTADLERAKEKLEREIVERKEAEEKFRNLAEQSPDMIFIIKEGKFAYVNQRYEEVMGYTKDELYSPDFDYLTTVAPESRTLKEANLRKHMNGEEVSPVEYSLRTKTGTNVNAITAAKLIDYEGQRAILVTATDITWRKQAEEKLRRAHDQWERTFEAVPDLICILDQTHRIIRVNKAVADRLGRAPEDLVGRHCYEVMHGTEAPLNSCPHTQLLADGQEHWTEVHEERLHGDFSICVSPLRNADGQPSGAVHVAHDITSRKAAEQALRRSERELAIRNKIAQIFLTLADEQMYSEVLHVVLEAMESRHGVFGYINEDGALICPSMTRDIWDQCRMADKNYVFPRDIWGGIWGRAMTEKKTLCSNTPFAVPEGHIPVGRALAVPLIYLGRVIGLLLVGNKAGDYEPSDREMLETIADYIAPILGARLERDRWEKQRREASQALQKARDELEMRVEERTSDLAKSQEALWRLTGRLLSVQEEERRRLARELHDDLTQRLAVLAIDAGKLEQQLDAPPDALREKIGRMKEQMVRLSTDVHDISRQLHPSIIDDLGLRQAIQSECVNFTEREGIAIRYEPRDIPTNIPRDISICLFRIVQEGLRNIARHANVRQAQVKLVGSDGFITLTIEDAGIGFDPAQGRAEAGLGLVSMAERARLIQGELRVESKPGEGTVITVTARLSGD
ncbi:MAG: MASE3 domain-containing protein [Planctomycetota bacterium]|jgi:PAS domain S-box-containing protein